MCVRGWNTNSEYALRSGCKKLTFYWWQWDDFQPPPRTMPSFRITLWWSIKVLIYCHSFQNFYLNGHMWILKFSYRAVINLNKDERNLNWSLNMSAVRISDCWILNSFIRYFFLKLSNNLKLYGVAKQLNLNRES